MKGMEDLFVFKRVRLMGYSLLCLGLLCFTGCKSVAPKDFLSLNDQLIESSISGELKTVSDLLEKGADPNARNIDGWPVLVLAAEKGKVEIVKKLLDCHANVNALTPKRWTALMEAAKNGYHEIVRLLLSRNAVAGVVNNWNNDALSLAKERGDEVIIKLIQDHLAKNDYWPLYQAVRSPQFREKIDECLSLGLNIDSNNEIGWTPLFLAVKDGRLEVVKYLLERGSNVNLKSMDNDTPLLVGLIYQGKSELIDLLLRYAANPCVQNNSGRSPLSLAGSRKDSREREKLLKLLKEAGATE